MLCLKLVPSTVSVSIITFSLVTDAPCPQCLCCVFKGQVPGTVQMKVKCLKERARGLYHPAGALMMRLYPRSCPFLLTADLRMLL